jgi:hypothetical protein
MAGERIGYVRESTLDQNEKRQLEGQVLDRVFTDKASGRETATPRLSRAATVCPRLGTPSWFTAWTGWPATSMIYEPWSKASPAKACGWSSSKRA